MKLFINEPIRLRKRLTKDQQITLRNFSIWFNNKHIVVQKCTVPENDMQELIDILNTVSKFSVLAIWEDGAIRLV